MTDRLNQKLGFVWWKSITTRDFFGTNKGVGEGDLSECLKREGGGVELGPPACGEARGGRRARNVDGMEWVNMIVSLHGHWA